MKRAGPLWRLLAAVGSLWALAACVSSMTPVQVRPPREASSPLRVAVFKSGPNPIFEQPLRGFLARFSGEVRIYDRVGAVSAAGIAQTLQEFRPDLLVCLGNGAAAVAKATAGKLPVVYAMVPRQNELNLLSLVNFAGNAMEPSPLMEFTQFKMVAPNLHRVVAFYQPQLSQSVVDGAKASLADLGVELVAVAVNDLAELKGTFSEQVKDADGVWMLSDQVVMNGAAFAFLQRECVAARKLLMTSVTDKFAEAGALMSAALDLTSLGSQMALLTRRILKEGESPQHIGVQEPIGTKLAVNLAVARTLGFDINPQVVPFINRVFAEVVPEDHNATRPRK